MKKIKILSLLMVVLLAGLYVSCSKDDDTSVSTKEVKAYFHKHEWVQNTYGSSTDTIRFSGGYAEYYHESGGGMTNKAPVKQYLSDAGTYTADFGDGQGFSVYTPSGEGVLYGGSSATTKWRLIK